MIEYGNKVNLGEVKWGTDKITAHCLEVWKLDEI